MEPRTPHPADGRAGPTRRQFITTTASIVAASAAAPAVRAAAAAPALWDLQAVPLAYTFGNGGQVPFFRYQPVSGGDTRGALPYFEATEGTPVCLSVHNQLPVPIRPMIRNVATATTILPGATGTLAFTMPPAGTYLLANSRKVRLPAPAGTPGGIRAAHLASYPRRPTNGLAGTLVSRPVGGALELWAGGPAFDREYVLLWDDADERWNAAMSPGTSANLPDYEPNYFTINGLGYPDTASDPDTRVAGLVGERILLRNLNAGRLRHALHFHGYHCEIAARDNVAVTDMPPKDTWPLARASTMDLILTPHQTGVFPLHPHHVYAVTANGLYPYGQLTLQDIQ